MIPDDMEQLAEEIIAGRRLTRDDDLHVFLTADLDSLCTGANHIRQELCGDRVDLCTIINGRSGRCSEDCKFCAQSCHYHSNIDEYGFLDQEEIVSECLQNEAGGADRFSIVTAGRALKGKEFEQALAAYRRMHEESGMILCASHGLQSDEEFQALRAAGVEHYHANIETSRRNFPNICTTHTYEDKLENIRRARKAGFGICSGGIIGMGETWEDRLDMAISLAELEVESIPLNILRPIPGTPLEHARLTSNEDVLRTVAFFRYINPTAWIRMAAGRNQFPDGGAALFRSGANAALTGNMLTTTGTNMSEDLQMFQDLGYRIASLELDKAAAHE